MIYACAYSCLKTKKYLVCFVKFEMKWCILIVIDEYIFFCWFFSLNWQKIIGQGYVEKLERDPTLNSWSLVKIEIPATKWKKGKWNFLSFV